MKTIIMKLANTQSDLDVNLAYRLSIHMILVGKYSGYRTISLNYFAFYKDSNLFPKQFKPFLFSSLIKI